VTSSDGTEKGDPSAAFMQDGVYIARPQAQEVSFFDIARVEVLRGPQGTLYGRNTTAGAINLITNRPTLDRLSGTFDAAYGNYNNTQITGVINAPVTENFGVRFGVNYDRRDSYLKAGTNFPGNGQNANLSPFKNNLSARLTTLWKFDKGELVLRGDYSMLKGITTNVLPTSNFYSNYSTNTVNPTYIGNTRSASQLLTLNAPSADGIGSAALSRGLRRDTATYGGTADFKYDLGPVTLNYIGSYRELKRHEGNFSYYAGGLAPNQYDGTFWQNSQELRFSTNGTGPIRAQAGAYYFKERGSVDYYIFERYSGATRLAPGQVGYVFGFPQHYVKSASLAGFGQMTYSPIDPLHITAGIRYTKDDKARIGATVQCAYSPSCSAAGDSITANNASRTYNKTTWKVGVDYDVDSRTMVYGTVSTGYKAGGFNDGCELGTGTGCTLTASALYYQPETLTAYEMGTKTRFFDNKLRVNLSVFHYDYKNLQLTQLGNFCAGGTVQCTLTTNAAAAKVDGVEVESVFQATHNDRFDVTASYLNARYGTFYPSTAYPTLNWAGKKLDRSPSATFFLGYTHTFPLANGAEVIAGVRSKISSSYKLGALSNYLQFTQPAYTSTELNLTYNAPRKAWYAQAFAKNLENNIVVTAASSGVNGTVQVADPFSYGARVGFKF
jgi:iron complex outermembrane receptor protein